MFTRAMESHEQVTVPRLPIANPQPGVEWFWQHGCVVERDGVKQVFIGGALMGWFDPNDRDRGPRNVLLVTLAKEPTMHYGHLARAFGIGEEYLRRLRRIEERDGVAAVLKPATGRTKRDLGENKRRELRKLFEAGWNAADATRRQRRGKRVSRATVQRERRRWDAERQSAAIAAPVAAAIAVVKGEQLDLFPSASNAPRSTEGVATAAEPTAAQLAVAQPETPSEKTTASAPARDEGGAVTPLRSRPVVGGRLVQHLGTWILIALAARDGLHDEIARLGGAESLRIAIDATLAALAIGELTVEGVRRLQTRTAPQLLRVDHTPTASTVRRRLWQFAKQHATELAAQMGQRYIDAARVDADAPAVFYVDNHLRPYSGKHVVRKGWRMQEKRVLPGTTDYYVHDEDGRPLFRIDVPSHDSLSQWLPKVAARLREALGPDQRILLAFDRAGAHANDMALLRDRGFEFVTYERKPFALLAATAFDRSLRVRDERYGLCEEARANLGRKRGRVRRISLRTPDKNQINVLAVSTLPAEDLVGILLGRKAKDDPSGRWLQENGFKHGAERWGINQLDGRKVESVPAGTIIPNPKRRRIERALTIARAEEGRAHRALAELTPNDPRRERIEVDLAAAIFDRVHLEMLRPFVPKHAPVEDTDLAGKLVRHTGELKTVVDTMRIVCANIEADLAAMIAPHLRRPREAKKVIANLFEAPGSVHVTPTEIRVHLAPAANRSERAAIARLLAQVSASNLTLPGDEQRRFLRFESHPS